MAPDLCRLRKIACGLLKGSVVRNSTGISAEVDILDAKGLLYHTAKTGAVGQFSAHLPHGAYTVASNVPGSARTRRRVELKAGDPPRKRIVLRQGKRSRLRYEIRNASGRLSAGRLTFVGNDDTETPKFGPPFSGTGAGNTILSITGKGSTPIRPGNYTIYVTKGPEFQRYETGLSIQEGATASLKITLERAFTTKGFIAADLHQHAAPSLDSGVPPEARVRANIVEGVEVMVGTDHNTVFDYLPLIKKLQATPLITSILGTEATSHSVGHFNAFPLNLDPNAPRGGMRNPEGFTPQEISDYLRVRVGEGQSPFVQINHPRAERNGYFNLFRFDPRSGSAGSPKFSLDFDGLEIPGLGRERERDQLLEDWYALLRRGKKITATGSSDTHSVRLHPGGWPRTYVCANPDKVRAFQTSRFRDSLKTGCATISAGPFLTIRSDTTEMGGVARARRGRFNLQVELQAAPWIQTNSLEIIVDGKVEVKKELESKKVERFKKRLRLRCQTDCFVLAKVSGTKSLRPVIEVKEGLVPKPFAVTNPIFVDADGDGKYTRPR